MVVLGIGLLIGSLGLDRLARMITELLELTGAGEQQRRGSGAGGRRLTTMSMSMSIRIEREHVFVSLISAVTSGLSLLAAATQLRRPPTLQGA